MGNPAEETCCHPNKGNFMAVSRFVNCSVLPRFSACPRAVSSSRTGGNLGHPSNRRVGQLPGWVPPFLGTNHGGETDDPAKLLFQSQRCLGERIPRLRNPRGQQQRDTGLCHYPKKRPAIKRSSLWLRHILCRELDSVRLHIRYEHACSRVRFSRARGVHRAAMRACFACESILQRCTLYESE